MLTRQAKDELRYYIAPTLEQLSSIEELASIIATLERLLDSEDENGKICI